MNRNRNGIIIALVLALLVAAMFVIVPGSPLSQPTRLGLDLKGGVELVYEARPTPQRPKVTPQAIDDAINTIRKRTDALGVSEPEIQAAGANQISIGLPAVSNAARAEQQVGTTAQLQFYDWEPNGYGPAGAGPGQSAPQTFPGLFPAAQDAAKQKPRAEKDDVPPGGATDAVKKQFNNNQAAIERYYDSKNDSTGDKYYLFGPGEGAKRPLIAPGSVHAGPPLKVPVTQSEAGDYYGSCNELFSDYKDQLPAGNVKPAPVTPPKGTACADQLKALGRAGPPAGSTLVKVPRGVVVVHVDDDTQKQAGKNSPPLYNVIEDDSELTGNDITDPKQAFDQNQLPNVTFNFTDKGKAAFSSVTKRIAQRGLLAGGAQPQQFAITLDNKIVSLASVDPQKYPDGIDGSNGAEITGVGDVKHAQDLAESLRIGALPVELKLVSKTQVSATLGKQALHQGLIAGGVGLALVLVFLLVFYRVLGLIAGAALISYAVILFAIVKLIPITLTLPGIAGLILTLGVAADANVVIFERIKEEARGGAAIPRAIATGYAKALRTIIDANVVTVGVAFVLFMLATAGVKGFAFTLLIGTLVSLLTAVLATSAILGSMSRSRMLRSRWALNPGSAEHGIRIDFSGLSRWFFSMSGLILLVGAVAIATQGINFGIDFESGTRIKTPLERKASVNTVRDSLAQIGLGKAEIQSVDDPELGKNVFQIQTTTLPPDKVNRVQDQLNKSFGVRGKDFSADSIGPTFGAQIAKTALIAIIASLVLISIYIGLRFEFKYAVPVLIALAHDLLITSGMYALLQREVTTSTVAALLTILGYSLYDTIIVFDRIRENVPRMPRATFSQIVNRSMSEVVVRSLVTSFCTLLPILSLMLFGGDTLKDFGFALLVGVASGAYSSIFIASPVLTHWKEREPGYRRRTAAVMQEHGGVVPAYADGTLGGAPEQTPRATGRARVAPRPGTAGAPRAGSGTRRTPPRPSGTTSSPRSSSTTGTGARRTPAAPTAEAPEPDAPTQAESPAEPPDGGNGASAAPAEREQPAGSKAATDDKASDKPINRRRKKHGRR